MRKIFLILHKFPTFSAVHVLLLRRSPVCIEETGLQCVAHAPSHFGWELGQARARVSSERGWVHRGVTHVAEGQGHESSSKVLRNAALILLLF
jgi:hypothetical protein